MFYKSGRKLAVLVQLWLSNFVNQNLNFEITSNNAWNFHKRHLQEKRNEGFDFENLRSLFHENVVVAEAKLYELVSPQSRVRTSHRNDLCFFHLQSVNKYKM